MMRQSKILSRVREGKPAKLCCLGHVVPAFVKHAAHFGYDGVWLDTEHRAMTDREIQSMLALFHLYDIDCMLRVPTREKARLYRYLEDGATGLMIPHVNTAEEAHSLAQSVKFPPLGDRGLDGAGLDCGFMVEDRQAYLDAANNETFLILQLETPQAIENVEAIAAVPGVDGLFVGTGDLGFRIERCRLELTIDAALTKVAAAAKQHNVAWGAPSSSGEHARQLQQQGAQLINLGNDFIGMLENLKHCSQELDAALQSP